MKRIYRLSLLLFLLGTLITGCTDQTNYQEGYTAGFQAGQSKGNIDGYSKGQKDGYNSGYTDGFAKSGKALIVTDIDLANLTSNTLYAFGTTISYVFLLLNITVIIISLTIGGLNIRNKVAITVAKFIVIFLALGCAYALFLSINVKSILFFTINGIWGYAINALLFFLSVWFTNRMYKLLLQQQPYLVLSIIFIFTFITFYFCLFLTDINTYILSNHFLFWSIFWIITGALLYIVYQLVENQIKADKSKKSSKRGLE